MDIEDLRLYFRSHIDPVVYEKRKESSEFIDQLLGFEISKIESNISKKKEYENWSHIGCSRFSTPYEECIEILTHLKLEPTARLVDVGAAYGRWGIIFQMLFPHGSFIGYEIEVGRVDEGNRIFQNLGLKDALIYNKNAKEVILPVADVYVIYDFGLQSDLKNILEKLKQLRHSYVLIARGGAVRKLIESDFPWLQSEETKHESNYSLYFYS